MTQRIPRAALQKSSQKPQREEFEERPQAAMMDQAVGKRLPERAMQEMRDRRPSQMARWPRQAENAINAMRQKQAK
jgi:hypothetical protein